MLEKLIDQLPDALMDSKKGKGIKKDLEKLVKSSDHNEISTGLEKLKKELNGIDAGDNKKAFDEYNKLLDSTIAKNKIELQKILQEVENQKKDDAKKPTSSETSGDELQETDEPVAEAPVEPTPPPSQEEKKSSGWDNILSSLGITDLRNDIGSLFGGPPNKTKWDTNFLTSRVGDVEKSFVSTMNRIFGGGKDKA